MNFLKTHVDRFGDLNQGVVTIALITLYKEKTEVVNLGSWI
jgi:hypothetical protein